MGAKKNGVDIFRVFDALNDINQLEVGINAVHKAGGVVEGTVCISGDMLNPQKKYNLEYYLDLVDKLVALDIHVLTHDSAGTGVASMVACAHAGADAVDAATDS